MVRPEPVPAVDGRCGGKPGISLLGVPTPLEDGGETLVWQCLGLNGVRLQPALRPALGAASEHGGRPDAADHDCARGGRERLRSYYFRLETWHRDTAASRRLAAIPGTEGC